MPRGRARCVRCAESDSMRNRRVGWPRILRCGASHSAAWIGLGLASILVLVPSLASWEVGGRRLELSSPDVQPSHLVIEPPLLAKLQTLAAGLHAEIALCLFGTVDSDTARLDELYMPEPTLSTANRSLVRPCPDEALAVWHNHPVDGRPVSSAWGVWRSADPARQARRLCVLSRTDIQTSMRFDHPFVIVSVDRDTWCWWTREEVARLAASRSWPGVPSPGKLATRQDEPQRSIWSGRVASRASGGRNHRLGAPR